MFTLTDLDLLFAPSMRWLRGPLLLVVLCLAAKVWFANRREFRKVRRCGGASRLGLICRSSVAVQWLMLASAAAFLWGALLWQAALSLLAIACAATAFHNARRRWRDAARACPRCAGMDTLKPESSGHYGGVEFVRCDRVISESPYVQCDFSYLSIYQRSPKLFLPTLGPPSSGKMLWLAMAYREMIRGCYDERISFQKLRSRFSEEFDRLVDDIINDRVGPAATQTQDFSYPLIFDFQDRDPWGKSNVLVSVFDYGGETVQTMPLDEPLRRRAFDADGYVFFCDPTRRPDEHGRELTDFRADAAALAACGQKGNRPGKSRPRPVAVCVSKIDLLVTLPEFHASGDFCEELLKIDAEHDPLSLALIQARSELVARFREAIWPGWQIEQQINDVFGGPCRFFPLTPVGLEELGETDLRNRPLIPYAILEPLLWLLHMNGYCVLK